MTPFEIVTQASERGVEVELNSVGDGLTLLSDDDDPPADIIDLCRTSKPEIVACLRLRQDFDRHIATVMRVRGLPRPDAERDAYAIVLTERLNHTHPDTPADRCAWCGKPDDLLPFGWAARHTWLHSDCHAPWLEQRRAQVEQDLARLGIVRPPPEEGAASPVEPVELAATAEPLDPAASSPDELARLEPPEAAAPEPVEASRDAKSEPAADPAAPSRDRRLDQRLRARIISWDPNFCLGCRKRILIGQQFTDVSDGHGAVARFHNSCLDEWIARHQAAPHLTNGVPDENSH